PDRLECRVLQAATHAGEAEITRAVGMLLRDERGAAGGVRAAEREEGARLEGQLPPGGNRDAGTQGDLANLDFVEILISGLLRLVAVTEEAHHVDPRSLGRRGRV